MADLQRLLSPLRRARDDAQRSYRRFNRQMRRERRLNPEDVGLPYDALSLEAADGQELAAWFVAGDHADRSAATDLAVFIHHHYGGQKATVLPWLELFHRLGIPSLAIDGRGHAASSEYVSEGATAFAARKLDVHAGIDELRRRGAKRVLAIGQSQGAAPVVAVAGARSDVAGVIVDSGPAPSMELATWGLAGQVLGTRRRPLARAWLCLEIWRGGDAGGYLADFWGGLARLRDRPLLWLHGDRDLVIPQSLAALWFHAAKPAGDRWTRVTISGGNHVQQPLSGSPLAHAVLGFARRLSSS
jgi:dienelactone hydrolase